MRHVWNEQYLPLYARAFRMLCDAGIDEKLADKLAAQRALAVALRERTNNLNGTRAAFGTSLDPFRQTTDRRWNRV
jgi:hypothetical protein